jgi:hypothetical protein
MKYAHRDIMNLRPGPTVAWGPSGASDYALGHRDARHAAAEIAQQAIAEIEEAEAARYASLAIESSKEYTARVLSLVGLVGTLQKRVEELEGQIANALA